MPSSRLPPKSKRKRCVSALEKLIQFQPAHGPLLRPTARVPGERVRTGRPLTSRPAPLPGLPGLEPRRAPQPTMPLPPPPAAQGLMPRQPSLLGPSSRSLGGLRSGARGSSVLLQALEGGPAPLRPRLRPEARHRIPRRFSLPIPPPIPVFIRFPPPWLPIPWTRVSRCQRPSTRPAPDGAATQRRLAGPLFGLRRPGLRLPPDLDLVPQPHQLRYPSPLGPQHRTRFAS